MLSVIYIVAVMIHNMCNVCINMWYVMQPLFRGLTLLHCTNQEIA